MDFQVYIYGRTLNIDFRELCIPAITLSKKTKGLVSQLINTDVISNGNINCTRLLFVKDQGYVLLGIGFLNSLLLSDHTYDYDSSNKRNLRTFVGIVMTEQEFQNQESLPLHSDFYVNLFMRYVPQLWNLPISQKNMRPAYSEQHSEMPLNNWIPQNNNIAFNNDPLYCKVFPFTEANALLSSLHTCESNLMIGLNNQSHIFTSFRRFNVAINNTIMFNNNESSLLQLSSGINDKPKIQNGRRARYFEKCKSNIKRCWENRPKFFSFCQGHKEIIQSEKDAVNLQFRDDPNINDFEETCKKNHGSLPAFLDGISFTEVSPDDTRSKAKPETMSFDWGDESQSPESSEDFCPNIYTEKQNKEDAINQTIKSTINVDIDEFYNVVSNSSDLSEESLRGQDDSIPIWNPKK